LFSGDDRPIQNKDEVISFGTVWAVAFEKRVRKLLLAEEQNPLIDYESKLGEEAMLAIPTPDHYLPLLYVIGTCTPSEPVAFPVGDGGSISMLAVQVG
jgi:4,5-DOPA dioxygenase extradiol